MPWCEPCGRFYNPNTLSPEGRCPADHAVGESRGAAGGRPGSAGEPGVDASAARRRVEVADEPDEAEPAKVPWHFWLLVVALVLYLGWRLVQGVDWLFG